MNRSRGRQKRGVREEYLETTRPPGSLRAKVGQDKVSHGRAMARQLGLEGKTLMVPVEEWLDAFGSKGNSNGASMSMSVFEGGFDCPDADLIARENVELLEENARLQHELATLRKNGGKSDGYASNGDTEQLEEEIQLYQKLLVWLATSGRTGNFIWLGLRDLLRDGAIEEALELAKGKGICG